MRFSRALVFLALDLVPVAPAAFASPAPLRLDIDQSIGKVANWSLGYSSSLESCVAAAAFGDGTTAWLGYSQPRAAWFMAYTNPRWRSVETGQSYELQIAAQGGNRWRGTATGFDRDDDRGVFQLGLNDKFIADLSRTGSVTLSIAGRPIASLSLVGSTDAIEAVMACSKRLAGSAGGAPVRGRQDETKPPSRGESSGGSSGTGFFVSDRGHVLTNEHVVRGCTEFVVRRPGDGVTPARLVATDPANDLAVLSTGEQPMRVAPLSVRARVGETVYVYGFPQTELLASSGNFTVGNVTATAGLGDNTGMLQISAPVHMGNSGGPVMDQFGNILGVVRAKATRLASGDVPQNVNFAIKSSVALNFLEANGIEAPIDIKTKAPMDGAGAAEFAREFTLQVSCR